MIDDGNDMVAGTSGIGSMVKGKVPQGRRMERTDRWDYASPSNDLLEMWVDFMNLNNLFLFKNHDSQTVLHLFYTTPQPAKSANTATTRIAFTFHATCTYAFII